MTEYKDIVEQTVVVVLAAGQGKRMGGNAAKVCFEIDGVPAINRLITTFRKQGFNNFLVVIGARAEQVLDTVNKEHPGLMFVYQSPQLGTGHAAKIAAQSLQRVGHTGSVLVTMGDKFIEEAAIKTLVRGFVEQHADMVLLTIPIVARPSWPCFHGLEARATGSGGRVLLDDTGQAIDIIEQPDLTRQAIIDELRQKIAKSRKITGSEILKIVNQHIPSPEKQDAAIAKLLELARTAGHITKRRLERVLRSEQLRIRHSEFDIRNSGAACTAINPSLYLFKADAFYQGVEMIDNNNAQREYYLTDIVRHLAKVVDTQGTAKFRTRTVPIDNPEWIQGFNSPDELLAIQDYVRRKKLAPAEAEVASGKPHLKPNQYCSVSQWINKIERDKPALRAWLRNIYGQHAELHEEKRKDLISVLACYGKRFGFEEKVCIVRAPGRVNLMGRHVDHQGGCTNVLAIDRETIAVAGIRADNNIAAVNTEPRKFKPVRFNISELIGQFTWTDWANFVNSDWVKNMLRTTAGDWGNYIKAPVLRLQHQYKDIKIRGLNLAVTGNVPIAAGLSSSSTIVVATLQAAIALNNLELTSRQLIDLCGQGEWFVGSRGGAGDHAAIYLGQRGKITRVGYLPFRVEKSVDAPQDYQVIIADSHVKAAKSGQARDMFNARVASYHLGLAVLKSAFGGSRLKNRLEYVRDLDPQRLGCTTSDVYRLLLQVPQFMSRKDLKKILSSEHKELMEASFASHSDPGFYKVRGVLLFGAAEVIRSRICLDYLEAGQIEQFGNLMKISHDGDRVSRPDHKGNYRPVEDYCDDRRFEELITDLASEDPDRVLKAQLHMQPGSYACSTPQIDQMVDIACSIPGVAGAQIAGAGLGGCIMILSRKDAVYAVIETLISRYYKPNRLKPAVIPCITVEGAGLAQF
jgi:N-acetylgalactosamine kinase